MEVEKVNRSNQLFPSIFDVTIVEVLWILKTRKNCIFCTMPIICEQKWDGVKWADSIIVNPIEQIQ